MPIFCTEGMLFCSLISVNFHVVLRELTLKVLKLNTSFLNSVGI